MLKLTNISAGYHDKTVIKNIHLDINPGQITTIIGPNGCGKSTLLKIMANSLDSYRGQITLHHRDIKCYSTTEFAQNVALLPQIRNIPNTTVETLISHGRFPYLGFLRRLKPEDHDIVEEAMRLTGVIDKRHHSLYNLSGGERQKVYIAMTLAQNTDIILLDEPTTFLDINHQFEILDLIKLLNQQGKTIIMVLHDIHHALTYSDQLIVMNQGRIQQIGSPSRIFESEIIDSIFNIKSKMFTDDERSYFCFEKKS